MGPIPYSERSALPRDSSSSSVSVESDATQITTDTSPESLSAATTPSPVDIEAFTDTNGNSLEIEDELENSPQSFYPTPADSMPFDHAFPVFLRQLTNERNLSNVRSLKIRVISRFVSLQRMSLFTMNLRELDLEGSLLGSLRDIGCNLKFLQVLKVGNCQLDSLDGTFGLTSLKQLYAQRNQIVDISPCSNLPHIQHIDLSHNRIRNISYAGFLSVCRKLESIVLSGNPATELQEYRNNVKMMLPQLKSLDNVSFEGTESSSNENESFQGEYEDECFQDDFYNNTFEKDGSASASASSLDYSETNENYLLKNKHQNYEFESEETSRFQGRDYSLLSLRREKDEPKHIKEAKGASVNIEETEDLFEHCQILYQAGDGLTLPPLNKNERESSRALQHCDPRDGTRIRTNKGEKSDSDISENYDMDAIKMGARPRTTNKVEKPSTANVSHLGATSSTHLNPVRPYSAGSNPVSSDAEEGKPGKSTQRSLTSGLPICGNLAVALRNRKKQQDREDMDILKGKEMDMLQDSEL